MTFSTDLFNAPVQGRGASVQRACSTEGLINGNRGWCVWVGRGVVRLAFIARARAHSPVRAVANNRTYALYLCYVTLKT